MEEEDKGSCEQARHQEERECMNQVINKYVLLVAQDKIDKLMHSPLAN